MSLVERNDLQQPTTVVKSLTVLIAIVHITTEPSTTTPVHSQVYDTMSN